MVLIVRTFRNRGLFCSFSSFTSVVILVARRRHCCAGASLEACIEATVASEVVLAYSGEEELVHASAWEGNERQVAATA